MWGGEGGGRGVRRGGGEGLLQYVREKLMVGQIAKSRGKRGAQSRVGV